LIQFDAKLKSRWVILQNNKYKFIWDLWIVLILVFVAFVVPYRLAFFEGDSEAWMRTFEIFDCMFLIDIVLTFFTSISKDQTS